MIRFRGQWWFYFKGVGIGIKPHQTMLGEAISDSLLGSYEKHEANPLTSAHAFSTWKHGKGVAMLAGKHAAPNVYYAPDGLNTEPAGSFPNKSTGFYYPDNFSDDGVYRGPELGADVRVCTFSTRRLRVLQLWRVKHLKPFRGNGNPQSLTAETCAVSWPFRSTSSRRGMI